MDIADSLSIILEKGMSQKTHNSLHASQSKDEPILSYFHMNTKPCTWFVTGTDEVIGVEQGGSNKVTYEIPANKADVLIRTRIAGEFPPISVKEEYRDTIQVAYSPKPATNLIEEGTFKYNKITCLLKSQVFDCEGEWNLDGGAGKEQCYCESIGDVPELTTFSTDLPSYEFDFEQPWFYSQPGCHWPLYKTGSLPTTHVYKFRSLSSILRVRQLDPETGVWTSLNSGSPNMKYLEIGEYTNPRFYAEYGKLTPEELQVNQEKSCEKDPPCYVRDFLFYQSMNEVKFNLVEELPISSQGYGSSHFYFLGINASAQRTGMYSNYTDNIEGNGRNSISATTFNYCGKSIYEDYGPTHFTYGVASKFRSAPRCKGYNAHVWSIDTNNTESDSRVRMGGPDCDVSLRCMIGSKAKQDGSRYDNGCSYRLMVIVVVLRPLHFDRKEDGSYDIHFG